MKKYLTDMLVCPTCKSDLSLEIESEENNDVISGKLHCENQDCEEIYTIEDSIPNLLPSDLR
ncbi:MAG: methytransferase partner Trm112 [Dehalococcoidia bacterium]